MDPRVKPEGDNEGGVYSKSRKVTVRWMLEPSHEKE